jgi:hypothetical protein
MLDLRSSICLLLCSWCIACAADATDSTRSTGSVGGVAAADNHFGNAGASGKTNFGNATGVGSAGTGGLGMSPAMHGASGTCSPGTYVGTYTCTLEMDGMMSVEIDGDISFDLTSKVKTQACPPDSEFCDDLVIAQGKLFGFAVLVIGFETSLEGGLDCKTGMFHAKTADGVWGLPVPVDPSNPDSPLTVADPPAGMFDGDMSGVHHAGPPEAIEGMWSLEESSTMLKCPGPFHVKLQP